jgi:hypothetical protein
MLLCYIGHSWLKYSMYVLFCSLHAKVEQLYYTSYNSSHGACLYLRQHALHAVAARTLL